MSVLCVVMIVLCVVMIVLCVVIVGSEAKHLKGGSG